MPANRSGRPSLAGGGRSPRLAVSLSPALHASASRLAEARGISIAELVRRLIAETPAAGAKTAYHFPGESK